jgi:transposase InsO family protein
MEEEKKQQIALFRFGVISNLIGLRKQEKGDRERFIAGIVSARWEIPLSDRTSISRSTVQEWISRYEASGRKLESLYPQERTDKGAMRSIQSEVQAALLLLRKEFPHATIPTILRIAGERKIVQDTQSFSCVSLWRLFKNHADELQEIVQADRRKFEAETVNDLWQADTMYGPYVVEGGKKRRSYLVAVIDDHSRLIVHAEFYRADTTDHFLDCLEKALRKRGMPRKLYVDNGPVFRCKQLQLITASLGISLVHTKPYVPEGKGKIERWFRTVRMQFLPVLSGSLDISGMNAALFEWIEKQYHQRIHSSTNQTPLERYLKQLQLIRPVPENLSDAFRVSLVRKVASDRTVSIDGTLYEAPVGCMGKTVTVRFHRHQMDRMEIFAQKKSIGFLQKLLPTINYRAHRDTNTPPASASAAPQSMLPRQPPQSGLLFSSTPKIEGGDHA